MHHPQVVQSPIVNDFLKVKSDSYSEPQLVPELLFQVPVRELHNNIVSYADNGGIKEEADEYYDIIISDYTLRSLLPLQLKQCCQYTRSWVVVNVAYLPKVYIHHYCHFEIFILKNSRISAKMIKTEGPEKKQIAYMKLIKIQSCHMGVILTPKHMT